MFGEKLFETYSKQIAPYEQDGVSLPGSPSAAPSAAPARGQTDGWTDRPNALQLWHVSHQGFQPSPIPGVCAHQRCAQPAAGTWEEPTAYGEFLKKYFISEGKRGEKKIKYPLWKPSKNKQAAHSDSPQNKIVRDAFFSTAFNFPPWRSVGGRWEAAPSSPGEGSPGF